ncbi:MAG: RNA polymerase subunit sigma, partial [Emcibacter sp.]|nr:RNA polymerase subunit sigma [Emcibacter sp.]
ERATLTLCFTYGMSHGETAEIMGYPLGTVKSHIARGKAKLKVSLASWQKEVVS